MGVFYRAFRVVIVVQDITLEAFLTDISPFLTGHSKAQASSAPSKCHSGRLIATYMSAWLNCITGASQPFTACIPPALADTSCAPVDQQVCCKPMHWPGNFRSSLCRMCTASDAALIHATYCNQNQDTSNHYTLRCLHLQNILATFASCKLGISHMADCM
jgi:hypothetical protein